MLNTTLPLLLLSGLLALETVCHADTNCATPPSGLVAWWPGEENVNDVAGANHGTLQGGATFAAGESGMGFNFNGTGSYVRIPKAPVLDVGNQVTIEFWMKADPANAMNSYQGLVTSDFYGIEIANGFAPGPLGVSFFLSTDGGASVSPSSYPDTATVNGGGAVVSAGAWHHVAGTYDGAKLQLYIDGQPQGAPNYHTGAISPMLVNSFVSLGSEDGRTICPDCMNNRYFNGQIDEPAIYNRALSAAEILAIYNAGGAGKCAPVMQTNTCVTPPSGIVSWWSAEENANDVAGNNNGTLQGGATFAAGESGMGFKFNGTGSYVKIPKTPALDVGNQITIEFWMKADPANAMNSYQGLVTSDFYGIEIANGYVFGPLGVSFFLSTDGGVSASPESYPDTATVNGGGAVVSAGAWHHVAGTYDGAKLQLYIDGQPQGAPNYHTGAISPMLANSFVSLGSEDGRTICPGCMNNRYFNGQIDEPSIYNRALSATEILTIYNAASAGKCALPPNHPPVANASATVPLIISLNNSNATAVIDGSLSSDTDNDPLQFQWLQNNAAIASGVVAVVTFPVGSNVITLSVSDGRAVSQQSIAVEVVTTSQAVQRLMNLVNTDVARARALAATLSAAIRSIDRNNPATAINQLQAFQNQVRAQVAPLDAALAAMLIADAQDIIDALSDVGAGAPTKVTTSLRPANGHMHVKFSTPRKRIYIIETAADLIHWEKIGVAKDMGDGSFDFDDARPLQTGARFYRVVAP